MFFPWPNINGWLSVLPGEVMFMFATETKTGKTSWLMNILIANALKGKKIINFSAELSPERYAVITVAHLVKANRDRLTPEDFQAAARILPPESFYVGYKPGAKFKEVIKLLEDTKQVYGGDIFVIDPIHFIIRGEENENRAFADAMRQLVDFSIKWNVIVIAVGQARKSVAGTRGKMAVGQDARFSAALSEDAATTFILHRNRANKVGGNLDDEPVFEPIMKVKLDYSRNSEPMSCKLYFDGATATFSTMSTQEQRA
jgi:replicative DNA helicase